MTSFAHAHNEFDFSHTSFLVVDDKPTFRNLVHATLAGRTAGIQDADCVEEAAAILATPGAAVDCVIADWDMLPVGGLELLRMIRCRTIANAAPRTSVVIVTGRADEAAVRAAMDMDVNGFVVAPLSVEKLIKTLTCALARPWILQQPSHYVSVPAVMPPSRSPAVRSTARADAATVWNRVYIPQSAPLPARGKPFARRGADLANIRICELENVPPGSILARDLRDRTGHLLLGTGTELKSTLLARLKHAAQWRSESYELWVGDPRSAE